MLTVYEWHWGHGRHGSKKTTMRRIQSSPANVDAWTAWQKEIDNAPPPIPLQPTLMHGRHGRRKSTMRHLQSPPGNVDAWTAWNPENDNVQKRPSNGHYNEIWIYIRRSNKNATACVLARSSGVLTSGKWWNSCRKRCFLRFNCF